MNVEVNYPAPEKPRFGKQKFALCCKWGFLFAGFILAVVNLFVGGKAWSIVAIWSMWLVWVQLVSPDMVEYNRISQTIKLIVNVCILLCLIDWLLTPGWAMGVVPVICFSALLLVSILFFTDVETQRQNMFPMLFFCAACLIGSVIGVIVWHRAGGWIFAVTGAIAASLLVGCGAKLGREFLREFKRRFCTK